MMSGQFIDLPHHMSYEASIAAILSCCKKKILNPYLRLISLVGWRPLFFTAIEPNWSIQLSNCFYLAIIILIMITGHALEYTTCHSSILSGKERPKLLHILPSIFHLAAYASVLYHSRKPESERLETLMERVFLQNSQSAGWLICHKRLLRQLRNFFIFCIIWVLISLATTLLHYFWYESDSSGLTGTGVRAGSMAESICQYDLPVVFQNDTFTTIRIICSTWNDLISAAIVTTYSVHCQLNISYIENLIIVIRERRITIQEFFKRVEEGRDFVDYLNEDQAVGPSLLMLNLISRLGAYMIVLLHPQETLTLKASCVFILCAINCVILIFVTFRHALRLTNTCKILRNIGHEIKSLQQTTSSSLIDTTNTHHEQLELDSLVLYTSSLFMSAKMLQIPIEASSLSKIIISITLLLLLLAQFKIINF